MEQELAKNEKSVSALADYAESRLTAALENAVSSVPYYAGLKHDLNDFKYIDKTTVKNNSDKFTSTAHKGVVIKGSTGGTTGMPLNISQSMESVEREQAFANRQRKWAGFKKSDKRAWIRGDMIVPIEQAAPPFWRYSYFEDMILLSSFHLTADALPLYIQAMVDYGVDVIQAYPSSVAMLAKYLKSVGEYYPGNIKSIITSSASLSLDDRQIIEERFCCKVFDWYGLFERVAAIANCEHGRYHVLTDYAHVEFLDVGDGRSEIVGTNFNNYLYPLIRYKTGDYVVLSKEKECPCGRVYPIVEKIEGRVADYVYSTDKRKVFVLSQCVKGVAGVMGSQFFQDKHGEVKVNVVAGSDFSPVEERLLIQNVKDYLGAGMSVRINLVDSLQKSNSGKVRQAICSIGD